MQDGLYTSIGLMSGTSLDGIDAAILITDGEKRIETGPAISIAYDDEFRCCLRDALARAPDLIGQPQATTDQTFLALERHLTEAHGRAIGAFLEQADMVPEQIDIIGFHGQTLYHAPEAGRTWQLGDGPLLAKITEIDVVGDFRSGDMASGGQGAPLAPVYHAAAVRGKTPFETVIIINIGGVANLTWIDFEAKEPLLIACDTGPGNALLDDWMRLRAGQPFDREGECALAGQVDQGRLEAALADSFFARPPPKSLDRDAFSLDMVDGLSLEDGAATLAAFTVAAVRRTSEMLPGRAKACFVSGGGRHNTAMFVGLRQALAIPVDKIETIGLRGDSLEAELMAFLAVRSLKGLPLTFPETTGVGRPCTGGRLYRAPRRR